MLDTINRVAESAQTYGLVPVMHPHAGGYIEYQDEVEKLLDDTDLALCLDTGHLAYAGMNPEQAIDAYAARIRHIHLKDIDPAVLARVQNEHLGFWAAIAAQIFCPLGSVMVDLDNVGAALDRAGYGGFATIEQDRTPGSGSPLCISAWQRCTKQASAQRRRSGEPDALLDGASRLQWLTRLRISDSITGQVREEGCDTVERDEISTENPRRQRH